MLDRDAIARWPSPEFTCHQASSYDRRSISSEKPDGWFANDDFSGRIRTETNQGRKEEVLMEDDGPGCLVRFWMTTDSTKPDGGVLRIYLDGADEPVFSFPAFDLLSADLKLPLAFVAPHPGYAPNGLGGGTMMLPIPYAKGCKVTWEEKSAGKRYYHINYRRYAKGSSVRSFTRETLDAARPELDKASALLLNPSELSSAPTSVEAFTLAPSAEKGIELPRGPHALRFLRLKLDSPGSAPLDLALRSLIVKIRFDNEDTVWCPASDFFATAVGVNAMNNWSNTVTPDGTMTSRWIMPYQRSGRITLQNLGPATLTASLEIATGPWKWDERSMHFHTAWHREAGMSTPSVRDWNFTRISGRGVYAGDTLALFNEVPTWYGEGDEKISVDGEAFPSHFGTGTEDYYGYSFAPRMNMQTPWANLTRVDDPQTLGHNVMSRSRSLDGIPFRKSLNFDIELMSWAATRLSYAATARWYAFPGSKASHPPDPAGATAAIPSLEDARREPAPFPGVIDAESLDITAASSGLVHEAQDMRVFGIGLWSRGKQLLVRGTKPGDFITLQIPAPDTRARELSITATQARDYGILRFTVNGKAAKNTFDGYAPNVVPASKLSLGTFAPVDGKYEIKVEVAGANPDSKDSRYFFGIDSLQIE